MSQSCKVRTYLDVITRTCKAFERIVTTLYVVSIVNNNRVLTLVRYLIVVPTSSGLRQGNTQSDSTSCLSWLTL